MKFSPSNWCAESEDFQDQESLKDDFRFELPRGRFLYFSGTQPPVQWDFPWG
jgi:hypothetical protein